MNTNSSGEYQMKIEVIDKATIPAPKSSQIADLLSRLAELKDDQALKITTDNGASARRLMASLGYYRYGKPKQGRLPPLPNLRPFRRGNLVFCYLEEKK